MSARNISDLNVRLLLDRDKFLTGLERTKKDLKAFTAQLRRINKSLGGLTGALAATFAVTSISTMVQDSIKLGAELSGVRAGFNKLNKPNLLVNLRKATRGTVTDLELMRSAVKGNNFKVPLEKMATFFEFATKRAIETGESVDFLVESIINGIGRKSALVLDNLGISAQQIQKEFRKTGDFGKAAANIIERELESMGDVASTAATKIAQIETNLKNARSVSSEKFLNYFLEPGKRAEEYAKKVQKAAIATETLGIVINKSDFKNYEDNLDAAIKKLDLFLAKSAFIKKAQNLRTEIEEMSTALGVTVDKSDLMAASHGRETEAVQKLREQYNLYLDRLETGESKQEQFIKNNKAAFKVYERQLKFLLQQEKLENDLADSRKEILGGMKFDITAITGKDEVDPAEELIDEAIEADAEAAEKFDNFHKGIEQKTRQWNLDDLQKKLDKVNNSIDNISTSFNALSDVADQYAQNSESRLENETIEIQKQIEAINKRFDLERDRINESTINSRLKNDAIKDNERSRASEVEKLEKKISDKKAQFAIREAKIRKATGITQSLINTAQGVTAALAQANIPLSIIIGALGAAQTGLIAAQPIPSFATGGQRFGGLMEVGERGRELIQTSGPTKVFNNRQSNQMLGDRDALWVDINPNNFRVWYGNVERKNSGRVA